MPSQERTELLIDLTGNNEAMVQQPQQQPASEIQTVNGNNNTKPPGDPVDNVVDVDNDGGSGEKTEEGSTAPKVCSDHSGSDASEQV